MVLNSLYHGITTALICRLALRINTVSAALYTEPYGIHFDNRHNEVIHISGDYAQNDVDRTGINIHIEPFQLKPGQTTFFEAPCGTSPKFYVGLTPNGAEQGEKRDHDTVIEATFGGFSGYTYYDMDLEKGFSVPAWIHGASQDVKQGQGCLKNVLSRCPQDVHRPHDRQCVNNQHPAVVDFFLEECGGVYIRSNDRRTKASTHDKALVVIITDPEGL